MKEVKFFKLYVKEIRKILSKMLKYKRWVNISEVKRWLLGISIDLWSLIRVGIILFFFRNIFIREVDGDYLLC